MWWTPDYPYRSSLTGVTAKDFGAAHVKDTGKPWTATLGFSHAIFEVGLDVVKRAADLTDSATIMAAITATNLNTMVGPITWANGPVKTVTRTPLARGVMTAGGWQAAVEDRQQQAKSATAGDGGVEAFGVVHGAKAGGFHTPQTPRGVFGPV